MNLLYFTRDAYKTLKKDIEQNKDKYYTSTDWLQEYFETKNLPDYVRTSSVKVGDISAFQFTGEDTESKNRDDLQNIKTLYTQFKGKLSPAQASDPCLWTALCHITFKDYVMKRWQKDDGTVRLNQRFFATEGRASLLYYNAISRLWWSGYLTYEEEKAKTNPWELTEILFSAQQIQKDLFDQPYSMNRTVVKGLLRALKRIQEETGNAATPTFRKCCDSYINHYGAVSILDSLTAEEVEEIAYSYMKEQLAAGSKK